MQKRATKTFPRVLQVSSHRTCLQTECEANSGGQMDGQPDKARQLTRSCWHDGQSGRTRPTQALFSSVVPDKHRATDGSSAPIISLVPPRLVAIAASAASSSVSALGGSGLLHTRRHHLCTRRCHATFVVVPTGPPCSVVLRLCCAGPSCWGADPSTSQVLRLYLPGPATVWDVQCLSRVNSTMLRVDLGSMIHLAISRGKLNA